MSTTDLHADLIRRSDHCERVSAQHALFGDGVDGAEDEGKAAAYRHAAELLRGAVAAAVEEEREAIADLVVRRVAGYEGESIADAIRARATEGRQG